MGTRADFYIGKGESAEWIGSVAWDGDEWKSKKCTLMKAKTEDEFRQAVSVIAKSREDWTSQEVGWPWPWEDSHTTDVTYAFFDGKVTAYDWGGGVPWPNMKDKQNVTLGPRSGLIMLRL